MRKPGALKPGDTIAIVSPASPIDPAKLEAGLCWFREKGFEIKLMPHVLDSNYHLAGRDEHRASDIMDAFADPGTSAVFCSRGGYGCARLLPFLNLPVMAESGKLFAGFSDISTLHLALNQCGLATLHAPMPLSFSLQREPWVYESLFTTITGGIFGPEPAPVGLTLTAGHATGVVTGGCLCLLCDSIGTQFPLDAAGKILLIEDVDEAPHRVDAMLTHLLNAGILQSAAGIVVGEMTRTDERAEEGIGGPPWKEIATERLAPLNVPTIIGYPFGHCQQMLSLPLGINAELDAGSGTLSYLEPLCETSD